MPPLLQAGTGCLHNAAKLLLQHVKVVIIQIGGRRAGLGVTTGIPAPLKRLLPDYKRMEEKIDAVIREKYGLPPVMSTPVKYADLIMLATERRDLGLDDGSFWPVLEGIPATEIFNVIPLAPGHAYGMFMERFNELSELHKCA